MKTTIIIIMLIASSLTAQEWDNQKWEKLELYANNEKLESVNRTILDLKCVENGDCYAVGTFKSLFLEVFKYDDSNKNWNRVYDGNWDPFSTPEEQWPDIIAQPRDAKIKDETTIFIYYQNDAIFNFYDWSENKYDTIQYSPNYSTRNLDLNSDGYGIADPGNNFITTTDFWKTYKVIELDFPSTAFENPVKIFEKRYMIADYYNGICFFLSSFNGEDWERFPVGDFYPNNIFFMDKEIGFVTGGINNAGDSRDDVIYKTTDGGSSWYEVLNQYNQPASWGIYDVSFVGNKYGVATSKVGKIYTTIDGGENWEYSELNQVDKTIFLSTTESSGNKFFVLNANQGILSYDATLLGITSVPFFKYKELTAYPNPFVNSIDIESDAVTTGEYKIKIYDVNSELVYEDVRFISGELKLNLELSTGAYFLLLEGEDYYYKKIIRE